MNLLIIEDDDAAIQAYNDNVELYCKRNEIEIQTTVFKNFEGAIKALSNPIYDAAIVDLRLSANNENLEGLEIIKFIKKELRFPVFVVSGSIGQIDDEESAFFKKRSRDGDFQAILTEIIALYNTGITKILGQKGSMERLLHEIFWTHLASSMSLWIEDANRNPEQKQKTLLRHILSHFQEHLDLNSESGFEDYHPAEVYIMPVIKPNAFTGDIVQKKGTSELYIILTPSCDLAQSKASNILLATIELESQEGLLSSSIRIIRNGTHRQEIIDSSTDALQKLIKNSYSNKYHYLPSNKKFPSGLINFQKIQSIKIADFKSNYDRIASINGNFTKDIIARFSYYYSRQGSPDFNLDEVYSSYFPPPKINS